MKERNLALLITIILLLAGLILGIISISSEQILNSIPPSYNEFNFYKSKLDINGMNIKETLNFYTDKQYHTLFRTFQSPITTKDYSNIKNSFSINSVDCLSGSPYFRIKNICYQEPDFTNPVSCPAYTENNEYGCTFGDYYGFSEAKDYQIFSEFVFNPENLFKINEKYYAKFIAYGVNNHHSLTIEDNFNINGNAVFKNEYPSNEYVIIYLPYNGDISKYSIIEKPDFEYGSDKTSNLTPASVIFFNYLKTIFMFILPGILLFCSWLFFGKELKEEDTPDQLSQNPSYRKPWEVAAFFNPPFGKIDKNFFSAMLLDFSRRKIIDIQLLKNKTLFTNKEEIYIRINNYNTKTIELDNIEKEFMHMLVQIKRDSPEKYKKGEYFNLKRASKSFSVSSDLRFAASALKEDVKDEGKKYMNKGGLIFYSISLFLLLFLGNIFVQSILFVFFNIIILVLVFGAFISKTSLLIKYKGNFYKEYKEWQSFKKWLKDSPAMKESSSKAVILWEKYLVYATALGVSEKILKELKQEGLIDDRKYNYYSGVYITSSSFATSSTGSSGGGGFGGAGVGGGGGGGGGGR